MGWPSVGSYKDTFQILKETIILYPAKVSVKGEGTKKAFSSTRGFVKSALLLRKLCRWEQTKTEEGMGSRQQWAPCWRTGETPAQCEQRTAAPGGGGPGRQGGDGTRRWEERRRQEMFRGQNPQTCAGTREGGKRGASSGRTPAPGSGWPCLGREPIVIPTGDMAEGDLTCL